MAAKVHERARVGRCRRCLPRPGRRRVARGKELVLVVRAVVCAISLTLPAWTEEAPPAPEAGPSPAPPPATEPARQPPTPQAPDGGVSDRVAPSAAEGEPAIASDESAAPPPAGGPEKSPEDLTSPLGDAYRPIGPQLFPIYEHYLRTADNTTVRNFLYLYRSTSRPPPDASRSVLLAPLFYFRKDERPRSQRFYLFPLLYFGGQDETSSFRYAVPFYFDSQDQDSGYRYLFPFWLQTTSEERQLTRNHILYPLFRLTHDLRYGEDSLTSSRFGIPRILEFWESRSSATGTDRTAFNFFNWSDETRSGLALYRSSWTEVGGDSRGSTYLFPLYWHRSDLDGGFLAVLPLYLQGSRAGRHYLWQFPLFGYSLGEGNADIDVIPLMPRLRPPAPPTAGFSLADLIPPAIFTYSNGPDRFGLALRPLFHYYRDPTTFSVAVRPFYNYARDENIAVWGSLFGLYRRTYTESTGKRTLSFLFPLVHHDVEPDGSRGDRWYFPYYETYNEERRWRFVLPILYLERQSLSAGEVNSFWRWGLPLYFAWGAPDDHFGFGFPLYWESRSGKSGWRVGFPLYWDFYSATEHSWFLLPLFVHRGFPSLQQDSLVWPFFVYERFYDMQGERRGTGVNLMWPLTKVEVRNDGYHYRLLPLFSISKRGPYHGLLLTPLFYQQETPRGTHFYFVPFYGRTESDRTTTDYYAGATVITSSETDQDDRITRKRLDLLWSLISHEKDYALGGSHTHVLPLMYWRTATPATDRTIAGPLYYSHRIVEEEKEHHLKLILGNLFVSRVTMGPRSEIPNVPPPTGEAPTVSTVATGAPPPMTLAEALAGAPLRNEPLERAMPSRAGEPVGPARSSAAAPTPPSDATVRAAAPAARSPGLRNRANRTPWTARSSPRSSAANTHLFPIAFAQDADGAVDPESPPPPVGGPPPGSLNPVGSEETSAARTVSRPRAPPERIELLRDEGFLWPLTRRYQSASGANGTWVIPFYYRTKNQYADTLGLFPLYFEQSQVSKYSPSYFRYFFLYNRERWREGHRWTVGQILVDWLEDETDSTFRLRMVYPLVEYERTRDGYAFDISSIVHLERRESSGERRNVYRLFPIYWQGIRERQKAGEEWELDRKHFFLFPLLGHYTRSTRTDYYALFPFFHLQDSPDALRFELWPVVFFRNEPSLLAFRLFPFHADETGELAGDFWVSRYLFLSKRFVSAERSSYRLEPFVFRLSRGEDEFGIAALFEFFAYDRKGEDWSFHAIPVAFGYKKGAGSTWGIIPLFYYQHFGEEEIEYATPWRFFFPVNRLQGGDGERHTSILGFLFDYTDNPNRPEYYETKVLLGLYLSRQTETSRQWGLQPFVSYYRDDAADEEEWNFLFNIYSHRTVKGEAKNTLLWFITF